VFEGQTRASSWCPQCASRRFAGANLHADFVLNDRLASA
jgi:hypothetical protein